MNAVISWCKKMGFQKIDLVPSGDFLKMEGSVSAINAALSTEVMAWMNKDSKKTVWKSLVPYSLPEEIAVHIDYIVGVHHFPMPKKSMFFSPKVYLFFLL